MRSDEVFLRHILEEINFLLQRTQTLSFEQFMQDEVLKRACTRSMEIIGEATKNISADLKRKQKNIDWRRIAGMRDKLTHQYFGVDWNVLLDVIKNRLPELKGQVERMLAAREGKG